MSEPNHSPDPRHSKIREHIASLYSRENEGLTLPWSGRHAKLLADFLKATLWPLDRLLACVDARFDSEDINLCEDPLKWIPRLVNYARGPLDRYGKPIYRQRVGENPMDGFESATDYFERLDRQKGVN